jgi:hypothetical protein
LKEPTSVVIYTGGGTRPFQGAIAPDIKVLEVKQAELREKFDDLYTLLNPQAAASARRQKIAKITPAR